MLPRRHWMEMTWTDLAGADKQRWIAVLPVAAVEQHGPHPECIRPSSELIRLKKLRSGLPVDIPTSPFSKTLKVSGRYCIVGRQLAHYLQALI